MADPVIKDYSYRVVYRNPNGQPQYWTPWPSEGGVEALPLARSIALQLGELRGECEIKIQRKELPSPWEDIDD